MKRKEERNKGFPRQRVKMELKNVVRDKKFWIASFLIAWAGALQGHMMWLQRQDSFKQKFRNLDSDNPHN
ncbi:hypothetical protein RJT34_07938 [Clitoria ternatea]|uniref:Uncharacterized protein n=1 Tax=Clitoria ternatea TaxID=43366 RepID=A0AAN9K5N9_CLITE